MLALAGKGAAPLAALLSDRDPLRRAGADLTERLKPLKRGDKSVAHLTAEAKRLARFAGPGTIADAAEQAALAYPDRIALRRPGDVPRWLLSGGKGAKMDPADPLAGQRMLVVTDTDGHPTEATIRTALAITEGRVRALFADRIETVETAQWSRREGRVIARTEERLGALTLSSQVWKNAPEQGLAQAMLDGVRELGLAPSPAAERLRDRVALVGGDLPDMSKDALLATLDDWLLPHLKGVRSAADWKRFDILPALQAMLSWEQTARLDRKAPAHFETPLGRRIPIDYQGGTPAITLRLQEMFGVTRHPSAAGVPLKVTLLSPRSAQSRPPPTFPGSGPPPMRMSGRTCAADTPNIPGPRIRPWPTRHSGPNAETDDRQHSCAGSSFRKFCHRFDTLDREILRKTDRGSPGDSSFPRCGNAQACARAVRSGRD